MILVIQKDYNCGDTLRLRKCPAARRAGANEILPAAGRSGQESGEFPPAGKKMKFSLAKLSVFC